MELSQISPAQLRKAADLKERLEELQRELESVLGVAATPATPTKLHWTQTPAGRAKLARSLRRSWRNRRPSLNSTASPASATPAGSGTKLHWTQTPAGKAKMARLMKKRWKNRRIPAM
ncbi:hypothetical protein SBV1_1450033 [Verrucomicrobia bacterium]|nr:hypothetical protein SBV1_1450033 [Verrucomicrobiota bacterium]